MIPEYGRIPPSNSLPEGSPSLEPEPLSKPRFLSIRVRNALARAGFSHIIEVLSSFKTNREEIRSIRNINEKGLAEIQALQEKFDQNLAIIEAGGEPEAVKLAINPRGFLTPEGTFLPVLNPTTRNILHEHFLGHLLPLEIPPEKVEDFLIDWDTLRTLYGFEVLGELETENETFFLKKFSPVPFLRHPEEMIFPGIQVTEKIQKIQAAVNENFPDPDQEVNLKKLASHSGVSYTILYRLALVAAFGEAISSDKVFPSQKGYIRLRLTAADFCKILDFHQKWRVNLHKAYGEVVSYIRKKWEKSLQLGQVAKELEIPATKIWQLVKRGDVDLGSPWRNRLVAQTNHPLYPVVKASWFSPGIVEDIKTLMKKEIWQFPPRRLAVRLRREGWSPLSALTRQAGLTTYPGIMASLYRELQEYYKAGVIVISWPGPKGETRQFYGVPPEKKEKVLQILKTDDDLRRKYAAGKKAGR